MEVQEEVTMTGSKEHSQIVKGKRTKRQRPQSPIPFAILTNSSSDDGGGGSGDFCYGYDDSNNNINTMLSPTTSNEFHDSTVEEEDMANCLILLAQGHSRDSPKQIEEEVGVSKFNSRRYLETTNPDTGKVGYYVYECKTCNRTFPSFQALGGHRASHKKAKAMTEEKKQVVSSDDEQAQFKSNVASLSLQLGTKGGVLNCSNKPKVHECSICGAEFTSGQALGGHMRRHRTPIMSSNNAGLSLSPISVGSEEASYKKPKNVLSLDLNLPAPEDDHRESKFPFALKQQQQQQPPPPPLVFTAPALVDCHY